MDGTSTMSNTHDILEVLNSLNQIAQRHKNAAEKTRHKVIRLRHQQDFLEMEKICIKLKKALENE